MAAPAREIFLATKLVFQFVEPDRQELSSAGELLFEQTVRIKLIDPALGVDANAPAAGFSDAVRWRED
jgi:hypothetical protein